MIFLDPYIHQMRLSFPREKRVELDLFLQQHEAQQVKKMLKKFWPSHLGSPVRYSISPTTHGWALYAEVGE